jgi:hypothetical protein
VRMLEGTVLELIRRPDRALIAAAWTNRGGGSSAGTHAGGGALSNVAVYSQSFVPPIRSIRQSQKSALLGRPGLLITYECDQPYTV